MSKPQASTREKVLAAIASAFEEAAPDGGGHAFVKRYFRHVPLDELTSRSADVYSGAAASHLQLARHRLPGVSNVRVYNPTTEADGWSNSRTVIQIVTDDMPFLVDSVTGALVNAGIDIHLIVHPQLVVSRDAVGNLEKVVARDVIDRKSRPAVGELAESWMLLSVDRESDEGRRAELESASVTCSRTSARPSRTGPRCAASASCSPPSSRARRRRASTPRRSSSRPASCAGWPTTTSPSSATATTPSA